MLKFELCFLDLSVIQLIRTSHILIYLHLHIAYVASSTWAEWWSYDGISGPNFWGMVNPDWTLCSQGKYQSPIDINPKLLLYDPNLRPFNLTRNRVSGVIMNTGHELTLKIEGDGERSQSAFVSGGPLTYNYRLHHLAIHFGKKDYFGSEHLVNGTSFPLELQLVAFNADLFLDYEHAKQSSFGISIISLLGQLNSSSNIYLDEIIRLASNVRYKGNSVNISDVFLGGLMPNTKHYLTYEGSLTHPGCQEVVTWIIVNKPLYISKEQLSILRTINKVEEENDRSRMQNNFRPVMPLNNRTVRTNIFPTSQNKQCQPKKLVSYEVCVDILCNGLCAACSIPPLDRNQGCLIDGRDKGLCLPLPDYTLGFRCLARKRALDL